MNFSVIWENDNIRYFTSHICIYNFARPFAKWQCFFNNKIIILSSRLVSFLFQSSTLYIKLHTTHYPDPLSAVRMSQLHVCLITTFSIPFSYICVAVKLTSHQSFIDSSADKTSFEVAVEMHWKMLCKDTEIVLDKF